ncbi:MULTISPECIES: Dabb family protein [Acetobacter]|uniref:Stress responsive protein n=1 Tax=Acetobacter tropicalis TaxID=104102 RepID=A0A149U1M2_9PROT|nr:MULTISPECIES: Dabb family protein [Acetobacter]KXV59189.1 stress responsive protein [Acetobacter tropicalis]
MMRCSRMFALSSLMVGALITGVPVVAPHMARAAAVPTLDKAAQAVQALVRQVGEDRFTAPDFRPGVVRHMVMFQFRPETTQAQRQEVTRRFLALAQASRRPDGSAVIQALEAGPQTSGENADLGLDYGYLVTFRSEGDRNYYVGRPIVQGHGHYDPAHDAFKAFAAPYLAKAVVFDFTVTP